MQALILPSPLAVCLVGCTVMDVLLGFDVFKAVRLGKVQIWRNHHVNCSFKNLALHKAWPQEGNDRFCVSLCLSVHHVCTSTKLS